MKINDTSTEETTTVIAKQLEKEQGLPWELLLGDAYTMMLSNPKEYTERLVAAGYEE